LYPADSVPNIVRRINQAFQRSDQIYTAEGYEGPYWFAPIVADAEAGFGGNLNAFELMKAMIDAGVCCRAFRGSTGISQEVRPHGRQGARADAGVYSETDCGPTRVGHYGRPYADHCATYSRLQEQELARENDSGYRGVKHQAFVGTGYYDTIAQTIAGGTLSTTALTGSTEAEQFNEPLAV
jgi:isocitrate lyase